MCWNVEIKLNYNKHTYLTLEALKNHMPTKDYFVGIDSDGTVFDSMEVKHKDCFVGSLIRIFELAAIAHEVHLVWNHVNIFSNTRGTNRFKALILTFNYLREIDRVKQLGIHFPKLNILKQWIKKGKILSNESLMNLINSSDPEERLVLIKILKWSEEVNRTVKNTVFNLPPLEGAKTAMVSLKPHADIMVISNTPLDTLHREWSENKIFSNVLYIGGQETGTKTEMLMHAAKQKYDNDKNRKKRKKTMKCKNRKNMIIIKNSAPQRSDGPQHQVELKLMSWTSALNVPSAPLMSPLCGQLGADV